jgi:hypothetical protein
VNEEARNEAGSRWSLWREQQIALVLVAHVLLQTFGIDALIDRIDLLPHICADSKRQRIPRLHLFSSA